jgi:hypothetical protein
MLHTFLVEPRLWKAKGTYTDENGRKIKAAGETEIFHKGGNWLIEGLMRLPMKDNKMLELRTTYKVKPLKKNSHETEWESDNRTTGKMKGKFLIAGNFIVSTYTSQDNKYTGFETLELIGENRYMNKGYLFFNDVKVSEWEVVLS